MKKGFSLVELIVSIILLTIVLIFMLSLLIKLNSKKEESNDLGLLVDQAIITKKINGDVISLNGIESVNCDVLSCTIVFGIGQTKYLNLSEDQRTLTYGTISEIEIAKTLPEDLEYDFITLSNSYYSDIKMTKISVKVKDNPQYMIEVYDSQKLEYEETTFNFAYTGSPQTFTAPEDGLYKIELWGAQGGGLYGAKGGYTSGEIILTKGTIFYVYVGQKGTQTVGGWNGGGNMLPGNISYSGSRIGSAGGGATDIRLEAGRTFTATTNPPIQGTNGGYASGSNIILPSYDAIQYGPYISLTSGLYLVTISGTNLNLASVLVYYNYSPNNPIPFTTKYTASDKIILILTPTTNLSPVEFVVQNKSTTSTVTVSSIRVENVSSRIMVAGGGGGYGYGEYSGKGVGGGLQGGASAATASVCVSKGGTQTAGGYYNCGSNVQNLGVFGLGGTTSISTSPSLTTGGGGGGGYYGGGGNVSVTNDYQDMAGGGGGSSFISGYTGCDAINQAGSHTGQPNHYSGYVFTNGVMIAGNATMPNIYGVPETGHGGNGYAKITLISRR